MRNYGVQKYGKHLKMGRIARGMNRRRESCPFGMAEIGKRMAWLAGWEDADREAGGARTNFGQAGEGPADW